jgi:UDP-N-acetylmuramoyl-tripeptide--D-alanyl-D-alanine ligase
MSLFTVQDVCQWLNIKHPDIHNLPIQSVSIDSRTLTPGALFIALKGPNFDGHNFIDQAIKKGAAAIICSQKKAHPITQLIIEDTYQALHNLAQAFRKTCTHNTLIALSGSCGKTTCKQMLHEILNKWQPTTATPNNQNNEIGVALQLLSVRPKHRFTVLECGTNHFGELAKISACAQPDIALLTMATEAHTQQLINLDGVIKAKSELFAHLKPNGIKIIPAQDPGTHYWMNTQPNTQTIAFGYKKTDTYSALNIQCKDQGCYSFELHSKTQCIPITLNVPGKHMVHNALAVASTALALGCPIQFIQQGLLQFSGVANRQQYCPLPLHNLIINDCYNANPASCQAALKVLGHHNGTKIAVLGTMGELDLDNAPHHYHLLATLANTLSIDWLLTFGPSIQAMHSHFHGNKQHFHTIESLITHLETLISQHTTILVKGSRAMKMERIVHHFITQKTPAEMN